MGRARTSRCGADPRRVRSPTRAGVPAAYCRQSKVTIGRDDRGGGSHLMAVESDTSKIVEMAALLADVQYRGPREGHDTLAEITDSATRAVPGAQYGGLTMVSEADGIRNVAATHAYVVDLDDVQRRDHDGPCLTAAWENHTVRVDDLTTDQRWPKYR